MEKRDRTLFGMENAQWPSEPLIEDLREWVFSDFNRLKKEIIDSGEPQVENLFLNALDIVNFLNGPIAIVMARYLGRTKEEITICDLNNRFKNGLHVFPTFSFTYMAEGLVLNKGKKPEQVDVDILQENWDRLVNNKKTKERKLIEKLGQMSKVEGIVIIQTEICRINGLELPKS